jgi:hypothetical protein
MREIKSSLITWDNTDEYAKKWDIKSTGLYYTPNTAQKRLYIASKALPYADKRLAGEMKNAEEGSTLRNIGNIEKSLRPNATVNVSKNFGFKFKARILQGKGTIEVKNPWIDCNADITATGSAKVITRKEFKQLGLASGFEYSVNDSQMFGYVDQRITGNVNARISNSRGPSSESRLELTASFPFNL